MAAPAFTRTDMDRADRTLEGSRYRLVPFDETMVTDRYVAWLGDPAVTRFLEVRLTRQDRDSALAFVRSFCGPAERYMWAIVGGTVGEAIGTCTLYSVNRYHGSAELGLMIGEREQWGQGASEEAIGLIAEFAFGRLELRRLTGGSYSRNHGMNFTYKRLGFTLEGRMRRAYRLDDDTYVDGYRWGLLADEWHARSINGPRA
jgi:RimJ/RimL family protein N-acetyltransferase